MNGGSDIVSRASNAFSPDDDVVQAAATPQVVLDANLEDGSQSPIIEGLLNRRSVLGNGSYDQVADSVLAANTRAAEADLRAATLRSEARASNWLPTLGPNISLTSMGTVVAQMVVDQVLFDNGKKRAEREYAQADVEVAAVALAEDTNERVMTALGLYLDAETAKARANVNAAAMSQMERYEYVMAERVRGGVSSRVDHQIVQQKVNQMRSDMSSDHEAAASAFAELNAMSITPLDGVTGINDIGQPGPGAEPLSVMKAKAEAQRAVAEATAARAGFLPSLTASAGIGSGSSSSGLMLGLKMALVLGRGLRWKRLKHPKLQLRPVLVKCAKTPIDRWNRCAQNCRLYGVKRQKHNCLPHKLPATLIFFLNNKSLAIGLCLKLSAFLKPRCVPNVKQLR